MNAVSGGGAEKLCFDRQWKLRRKEGRKEAEL
jgi:hypothetical protein